MKTIYKNTGLFIVFLLLLSVSLSAQESNTQYSLWFGSHYTGLNNYIMKVAEFDRGVEGISPELNLNFLYNQGQNRVGFRGYYYDPKRMNVSLRGQSGKYVKGDFSYKSFYRQYQLDPLTNMTVREAGDREGIKPGGKMITHEINSPNEDLGFRRQELQTNLEVKIPGLEKVKFVAHHRSILEEGKSQHVTLSHCASCHLNSKPLDLKQDTHSLSAGMEVDLGKALLTYEASYRTFKSDVGPFTAVYDTARHPTKGTAGSEFASRMNYSGGLEIIGQSPQTEKFSHHFKLKANVGKGRLLAQYVNMTAQNKANPNEGNVFVNGDLNVSGNYANLKFAYPIMPKAKLVATGYYGRYKNNPVNIDLPTWRPQAGDAAVNFDWIRYSNLTRTELRGNAEFIYQPTRKYRLSVLADFSTRERDDYPAYGDKFKTTKIAVQTAVRYRPTAKFTGNFKYRLESIDNPFSPFNNMFERYARSGQYELLPEPGTPAVYYYQRDQIRYGNTTNLPTLVHTIKLTLAVKPNNTVKLNAGVNARIGSNSDAPELNFQQKMLQPNLTLSVYPNEKFSLFGNYAFTMQEQNFLAAVTMMDG